MKTNEIKVGAKIRWSGAIMGHETIEAVATDARTGSLVATTLRSNGRRGAHAQPTLEANYEVVS